MKVFVTLGTTPFVELLDAISNQELDDKLELVIQSTELSGYSFTNSFEFTSEINKWYQWADVVITHAGAGSIYNLLELRKNIIVVPNTYRKDKHQLDISKFVEDSNYGIVCYDLAKLSESLELVSTFMGQPYKKNDFSGENLIATTLFSK